MPSADTWQAGAATVFAVTVLVSLAGLYLSPAIIRGAALRPYAMVRDAQYWRLISSGFVHANLSHLIFNLVTFYFFAFPLERRVGTAHFVALYFIGLLVANLGTCYKHRAEPQYVSLGASGAILGVLFASIVYFPNARLLILPIPIPIPAPLFAVLYLGYSFYQSRQPGGRINHDAHISGAVTGLAFVAVTDPAAFGRLLAAAGL